MLPTTTARVDRVTSEDDNWRIAKARAFSIYSGSYPAAVK